MPNMRRATTPTQQAARLLRERDPHDGETPAQRMKRIDAMSAVLQAARAASIPAVELDRDHDGR